MDRRAVLFGLLAAATSLRPAAPPAARPRPHCLQRLPCLHRCCRCHTTRAASLPRPLPTHCAHNNNNAQTVCWASTL